ncbi:16S rRNA pseudouridine(516) synthase RsuA [Pseudoalteromonas sp. BDTF-M6]|uniref:16S rRNA pseudouridine(516) synthase RsuA n=1 Tax=Pseudoalteromonas sp. BDTF-M6 TaxID=2796132 RepID=UPI001BAF3FC8|nr:16S rRNA pseudouridine(516) synthase RsuA [Pseudoalteromonas sp. BDTF-M6]MBS3798467.1 16S rRNA pseudouridine(516) synthase RsuA [Pseudoalteromonas sp. BDTF-M6]
MKFPCRLDKFISNLAEIPRTHAKAAIKKKRVTVNGEVTRQLDQAVTEQDEIMLDGELITYQGLRYFMLNKPEGFVCANSDELHATVFELLDEPNLSELHIAGRLDIDTTGLVLISNDGQWSHQITSPKKQKFKTYLVELAEPLSEQAVSELEQGVQLHGERDLTLPAKVEVLAPYQIRLHIVEGKYHQVKRMLAAVGNKVVTLHREAIAGIELDPDLAPGEYRLLSEEEIAL